MKRRSFLKQSGFLAAGTSLGKFIAVAGPFTIQDFAGTTAPSDKKLNKDWIKSLYERGKVTAYSKTKNELRFIGMPVGGICCGTVYTGGDGRLWLWDIFNRNQLGAVTKMLPIKMEIFNVKEINNVFGSLYLEPALDVRPLQQGFALAIKHKGSTIIKRIHEDDWDEIIFEATYPVATIRYISKNLPLEVSLKAFSPFIPGDELNSGLPATIQSISFKNSSPDLVTVDVIGWLENKMFLNTAKEKNDFKRENKLLDNSFCKGIALECFVTDKDLEKAPDFGNMSFATLGKSVTRIIDAAKSNDPHVQQIKDFINSSGKEDGPIAVIASTHVLKPNQKATADFIISWYTPNISFPNNGPNQSMTVQGADSHYYTSHFADAASVAGYIAEKYRFLKQQTMLWMDTWYDSTLPWWFMERTFMNISTLATTTSHRFKSGRFYAWEGVGCCHGTCTHVYQYAQAMARIFPGLERDTRERVDLGIGFDESTGMIRIRGEKTGPSIDGQAGTVLRIYREYLMSKDGSILRNNWEKIKKAVVFIMQQDKNNDGMEDTPMENTLDALWSGEISWIVGLCIAGVLAGQKLAEEMNDEAFASSCKEYVEKGRKNMEQYLFNGEYFIHRPDPAIGKKGVGSYNTCHIDQVYGQSWAWQVGIGRILDKEKTMSALHALWKYNYMPDVGPYIKQHPGGRFYAMAGEGGMVMNTNPANDDKPYGEAKAWQIGYFSECMSGFEYQVAAHMMAEGMIDESLVLTKTIHDRYHAFKRNPFNEIECSDHYARAMTSYGVFINACGFTYHGPQGHIGFAPKINPEKFAAPFTAAVGWGSFSQQRNKKSYAAQLKVKQGELLVKKISIELDNNHHAATLKMLYQNKPVDCKFSQIDAQCEISIVGSIFMRKDELLSVEIS
jgi:non-lysosomal glucosylceramidase